MLRKSNEYNEFSLKLLNLGYPVGDPKSPEPKEVPSSFLYLLKGHVSWIIKRHRLQIESSGNCQKNSISKIFIKNGFLTLHYGSKIFSNSRHQIHIFLATSSCQFSTESSYY
jgi:hypothetical protein